ncbi:sensor histidine kinase [Pseudomonadota bacterium]
MNSIRVFLVLVTLAVLTLFTFVVSLRGFQSSMVEAGRLFDSQLLDIAHLVAETHSAETAARLDHNGSITFQVWRQGVLESSSSNAPTHEMIELKPGFDFSNFGGYRWRTVAYYDTGRDFWVVAAQRMDLRYTLAENVILESIYPVVIGLPVLGLLIWLIVGQGLKPLRSLAADLGNKQPEDLSPLTIHKPKRELQQIVSSSNRLLSRLETSLLREKQFASDVAHELRTPISALKVQLYNLSKEHPEDHEGIAELAYTTGRLERVVEQILDLYRSSPDRYTANFVPIDLAALVQEILARAYPLFDRKNQTLEFLGDSCFIRGDRFALTTLIYNLLSNASKYTPEKGNILVRINRENEGAILTVEDSGPGIPEDQRRNIFDRFYRIGGDHGQLCEPGSGLGLAIVKRIAELHETSITVTRSRFDTGAAFQVSFPVCHDSNTQGVQLA